LNEALKKYKKINFLFVIIFFLPPCCVGRIKKCSGAFDLNLRGGRGVRGGNEAKISSKSVEKRLENEQKVDKWARIEFDGIEEKTAAQDLEIDGELDRWVVRDQSHYLDD
jgi:hypothetical protein